MKKFNNCNIAPRNRKQIQEPWKIRVKKYTIRPLTIEMAHRPRRANFGFFSDLIFLENVWYVSYQDIPIMQGVVFVGRRAVSRWLCLP